ncbi:MAG: hypothetical protein WBP13_07615 [Methylophilaceae bacterium]
MKEGWEDWVKYLPDKIIKHGILIELSGPLRSMWPIAYAEIIAHCLADNAYAMLGGALYIVEDDHITLSGDRWRCDQNKCDRNKAELWANYCVRSAAEMLVYMSKISSSSVNQDVWFTVVATNQPDKNNLLAQILDSVGNELL